MLGTRGSTLLLVLCAMLASLAWLLPGTAHAAVGINPQLSFEGKIVTASGINVPDGTYNMEFKIYAGGTSTGGGTLDWTEDRLISATQGVTFTSGTFQVNLGSVTPFASLVDWNSNPLYLSMQIGSTTTCTPAGNFTTNCSGDGEMSPFIQLTATPYALNSDQLDGLTSAAFGQLSATQTWTARNIFQPTGNVNSVTIMQSSNASPTADIFNVQTADATNVIQVTGPSANTAAVSINSVGGTSAISLNAAGAVTISAGAASTWDLGSAHTLSLQTTNNAPITTGSGLLTTGGSISVGGDVTLAAGQSYTGSGAVTLSSGGANTLSLDSGGAANIIIGATNAPVILIGSDNVANTTQHLLQLNSVSTFTEADACTTSSNQGAVYYNSTTNAIRSCVNGGWEDLVTTAGLGIILFGVAPDSGTVPGDLQATSTAGVSGPCKVSWASATSVNVQACTLFSGGRKIIQSAVTITLPAMSNGTFSHLCYYNGGSPSGPLTNSTAWFTTPNTTESANLPTFSANNPVLCIATIKNASPGNKIAQVFDTRVFTNSIKRFVNNSVALAPSWITIINTANTTQVTTTGTAATKGIAGVVAVGASAAWSSGGPNAILVTDGPAEVETLAGTTTAYNYIETSGTAGYATTVTTASVALTLPNLYLGVGLTAFGSCGTPSASTCQGSLLTQIQYGD